jgi:hypothetical protein
MMLTAGIESAVGKSMFTGVCGGDGGDGGDGAAACAASAGAEGMPGLSFHTTANRVTRAS